MNNKIFINSIIATAILIGVSFTSVVGYRSVASDMKASPLFNIRSSRAIDKEIQDMKFAYIGKGKNTFQFPKKGDSGEFLNNAINTITNLNNKEFSQLITSLSMYFSQKKDFTDNKIDELTKRLYQFRTINTEENNNFNDARRDHISRFYETCFPTSVCWELWCLLFDILMYIADFFGLLFYLFITSFGVESLCISTCISHY